MNSVLFKKLYGLLLGAATINGFAADNSVYTSKVGSFEVSMLMEARGTGNASILIGATEQQLQRYVPEGTYISQTNVFVIRSREHIIVVDTGFGRTLLDNLKKRGIAPEQVDAVLLTHLHGDHTGGLQRDGKPLFPKALVFLSAQEMAVADKNTAQTLLAYGEKVHSFLPQDLDAQGTEIFPGIKAIAAFGHTPGHTVYQVEDSGQKLLIWGDLIHVQNIQFPLPDIAVRWDADPQAAIASRRRILKYVTENRIAVAGMHLTYPAMGTLSFSKTGYNFTPLEPR